MNKTVLVTGCFGFIGSHLVEQLLEKGYHVMGIGNPTKDKQPNYSSFINSSLFDILEKDIMQIDTNQELSRNIDTIFHLAVNRNNANPLALTEINVTGTVNILELARQNDVKKIVFSSSAAVYGISDELPITEQTPTNPQNVYAASKLSAEKFIDVYRVRYGIETAVLRFFNVFGPRQATNLGAISIFINKALRNKSIRIEGDGSYRYTPIFVLDLVNATILASQKPTPLEGIINICGLESVTIGDVAYRIIDSIERSKSTIQFVKPRPNWGASHIGDTETMREILDFKPRWGFDEALKKTIKWYIQSFQ